MATCPLTSSYDYAAGCTQYPGGVKVIAFVESYNKGTSFVESSGVVTTMALAATKNFRTYRVKKSKSFVTDNATRTDAGGKSYKPTISMFLPDLSTQLREECDKLMNNSVVIAWMDYSNVWRLAGYYNLMEATTGEANFGTVIGDSHAQTIVFVGEETRQMFQLDPTVVSSLGLPTT